MPERVKLLERLMDDDVIAELKRRLGVEGIADLVEEIINQHRELGTTEKARLARKSPRTIRDRESRGS